MANVTSPLDRLAVTEEQTTPWEAGNGVEVADNFRFKVVSDTLLAFGSNLDNRLGIQLGIIAVLHTWDQKLRDRFHLHCLVHAGALCDDKTRWEPCSGGFLFHVKALSIVLRMIAMARIPKGKGHNAFAFLHSPKDPRKNNFPLYPSRLQAIFA